MVAVTEIESGGDFFRINVAPESALFSPNFLLMTVPCGEGEGVGYGKSFRAPHRLPSEGNSKGLGVTVGVLSESLRLLMRAGVTTAVGDGA